MNNCEFSGWVNKERQARFEAIKVKSLTRCTNCGIPADCDALTPRFGGKGGYHFCSHCMIELELY